MYGLISVKKSITLFASVMLVSLILIACSEDDSYKSDDAADYNKSGEYKPVGTMTQDEIGEELEGMFEGVIGE